MVHEWLQYMAHNLEHFESSENENKFCHINYPNMDKETFMK